jgi:hypothetical protein
LLFAKVERFAVIQDRGAGGLDNDSSYVRSNVVV